MTYSFLLAGALLTPGSFVFAQESKPVTPTQDVRLFNGKDLTGLTTWLKKTKREDPNKVFTVKDGIIHVSGDDNGYLATDKEYQDYHLIVEYKWGKKTDGGKYVRNSGILLHGTGADGAVGGVWMASIECQLAQGCVGDLIVIRNKETAAVTISAETVVGSDKRPRWKVGGEVRVHQRTTVVVAARSRLQGTDRHARQERRRQSARRLDQGRVHLPGKTHPDHRQRHQGQRVLRRFSGGGQDTAAIGRIRDRLPPL